MAEEFVLFTMRNPVRGFVDASTLPHPKDELIGAFANVIANCKSKEDAEAILLTMRRLVQYGVGESEPLSSVFPHLDEGSDREMSDEDFESLMNTVKEKSLPLMRKHSDDIQTIWHWYFKALEANPHLLPRRIKLWHWLTAQGAFASGGPEPIEIYVEHESRSSRSRVDQMGKVPQSGAFPDYFDADPFFETKRSGYEICAYHDLSPLAVREGGSAILEYPLVLAVFDDEDDPLFFVTVEVGKMFNTCHLCTFDGLGNHANFGSWDLNTGSEEFVQRALAIVSPLLHAGTSEPSEGKVI